MRCWPLTTKPDARPFCNDAAVTELAFTAPELPPYSSALLQLQHTAYAVEAALLGDDRIPALHETEEDLLAAGLDWLFELDETGTIVGALGYRLVDEVLDLDRLVVDPGHHRRGIGARLVRRVLLLSADRVVVSTGRGNAPARKLYEQLGFLHLSDHEVIPGLWISEYALTHGPMGDLEHQ